jgi:hypothetical protein
MISFLLQEISLATDVLYYFRELGKELFYISTLLRMSCPMSLQSDERASIINSLMVNEGT